MASLDRPLRPMVPLGEDGTPDLTAVHGKTPRVNPYDISAVVAPTSLEEVTTVVLVGGRPFTDATMNVDQVCAWMDYWFAQDAGAPIPGRKHADA